MWKLLVQLLGFAAVIYLCFLMGTFLADAHIPLIAKFVLAGIAALLIAHAIFSLILPGSKE